MYSVGFPGYAHRRYRYVDIFPSTHPLVWLLCTGLYSHWFAMIPGAPFLRVGCRSQTTVQEQVSAIAYEQYILIRIPRWAHPSVQDCKFTFASARRRTDILCVMSCFMLAVAMSDIIHCSTGSGIGGIQCHPRPPLRAACSGTPNGRDLYWPVTTLAVQWSLHREGAGLCGTDGHFLGHIHCVGIHLDTSASSA